MSQPGEPRELTTDPLPTWYLPVPQPPAPREPPVPVRQVAVAMVTIAVAVAALGAPFGALWAGVAPDVPLRAVEGGLTYAEAQPEQLVAADGWFAILAVPFGVLAAVGVWFAARRVRGLPALVALTVGAVGAGLFAWWLGRQFGLDPYQASAAAAEPGMLLQRPPDLSVAEVGWWPPRVLGVVLVPAFAAAAAYTLAAAWSKFPTLRPVDLQGAEPDRPAGA